MIVPVVGEIRNVIYRVSGAIKGVGLNCREGAIFCGTRGDHIAFATRFAAVQGTKFIVDETLGGMDGFPPGILDEVDLWAVRNRLDSLLGDYRYAIFVVDSSAVALVIGAMASWREAKNNSRVLIPGEGYAFREGLLVPIGNS